jgi:hypothetical protein
MLTKRKDGGWKAEDVFPLDQRTEEGERRLTVSTYKIDATIISRASVSLHRPDGVYTHRIGYGAGGDFSRRIIAQPGRGTEKAVAAQHAQALAMVPQLLIEAKAHYAPKQEAA